MINFHIPAIDELGFREALMADPETMSYNDHWGGTIPFPKERWESWYSEWVAGGGDCFYRYIVDENNAFVGEAAYHRDRETGIVLADVIVLARYRGRGLGREALIMLCECAKERGIDVIYDNIAIGNGAIKLFLECGFEEEYRTDEIIMLRKVLRSPKG